MKLRSLLMLSLCAFWLASCESLDARRVALNNLAQKIDSDMAEVRIGCERAAAEVRNILDGSSGLLPAPDPAPGTYSFFDQTSYYKAEDDGLGGVWASGYVPVGQEVIDRIHRLQAAMPLLRGLVEELPGVVQAYYLSDDHFACFYPYLNAVAYFDPLTDFSATYKPYSNVMPENDPQRRPVWIRPYVDATGKGYVTSVSTPVYVQDHFRGAVGADVRLLDYLGAYLDPERRMILLSSRSLPLAMTDPCARLLGVTGLSDPHYFSGGMVDEHAGEDKLLANSPSRVARELVEGVGELEDFALNTPTGRYRVLWVHVPEVDWYLAEIVEDGT